MPHRSSPSASWRIRKHRYALVGTKCSSCKKLFYPPREICTICKKGIKEPVFLSGFGVLESFTVVHAPPAGFEGCAPYVVGIVKLDEGVKISAQIVNSPEECKAGVRVVGVFRRLYVDGVSGLNFYGTKFKVA